MSLSGWLFQVVAELMLPVRHSSTLALVQPKAWVTSVRRVADWMVALRVRSKTANRQNARLVWPYWGS